MSMICRATAVKDSPHRWLVEIPEVGTSGQAASLMAARPVAREVTALWLNVNPSQIDVVVCAKPNLGSLAALAGTPGMADQAENTYSDDV